VSILGWVLIGILVLAEVNNYLTPQFREHMVVDVGLGQQLRINVNVTFHALTCNEVHLDAMDVAGDNQLNVEHEMVKQRISKEGKLIGHAGVEIIGEVWNKLKPEQSHPSGSPPYSSHILVYP